MASQRFDGFDFTVFGLWFCFRCSSIEEGISVASDGSENPQKGPRSMQILVLPLEVWCGRVGILGNFRLLKVGIAEVVE